jgi:acetyltransferase-like isoleucine patch superfamily enzyme
MARSGGSNALPKAPLIKPPFYADYGLRINIHPSAFINRGCSILDTPVADVVVGERVDIGTNVTICSVDHNRVPDSKGWRASSGAPVVIKKNAWIAANATILYVIHLHV